jgi:thiol:disulfide interchange protein
MSGDWIQTTALIAGITLPLFNVPLIVRIIKRRSSADLSMSWALGVWACIVLMTPQALRSDDISFRLYGIVNIIFFSGVVFFVLKYRPRAPKP